MPDCPTPKPLAAKLGITSTTRGALLAAPPGYRDHLAAPPGAQLAEALAPDLELVQIFVTARAELGAALPAVLAHLAPRGVLWVSWPKKASGVPTDVTEDRVRDAALPLGLVDVKVCAVDAVWSGLKLVRRLPPRR